MNESRSTQPHSGQAADQDDLRPFRVNISKEELADLRRRVEATRFPEKEPVNDNSQGVPLATVQALAKYWKTDYVFEGLASRLKAFPHFITEIDGLDIHFIHVRSPHEDALPLIVTHGWPGSIVEQLKIIEPLTDPPSDEDALTLCGEIREQL